MSDKTAAQVIYQHLGGQDFTEVTGARDFLATEHSLRFRLPGANVSQRANIVEIIKDLDDSYTIKTLYEQRSGGRLELLGVDFTSMVRGNTLLQHLMTLTGSWSPALTR